MEHDALSMSGDLESGGSWAERLRLRNEQLTLLARVSKLLILDDLGEMDLLTRVFEEVSAAIGADMFFNYQPYDEVSMRLCRWAGLTDDERVAFDLMRYGELLCGRVAVRRERLVVEDIAHTEAEGTEAVRAAGYGAYAGFPLLAGDRLLGTVAFVARTETHFGEGEVETVQAVCDQAASMLERARLTRELAEREEQLSQALEAASAGTWSVSFGSGEFSASNRALAIHGLPPGTTITSQGAMACVHPEDRVAVTTAIRQTAEAGLPFRHEHRVVHPDGSLRWVASFADRYRHGSDHKLIGLVQDITARKRAEHALRAREAEERETAIALQRALLPTRLPVVSSVEVDARYAAGGKSLVVGGDWYDVHALDDGRVLLTVGDVVGHGLEAAVAMGQLRTAVAAFAPGSSPATLLGALDRFVARLGVTDFATVCVAFYDPESGRVDYASAGHPPIIAVSPGGQVTRLDAATSPPLCGLAVREHQQASLNLEAGTVLLLYSDGLIERRDRSIETGLAELASAAQAARALPVDHLCDELLRAQGIGTASDDDVVIMVARVTHAAAS